MADDSLSAALEEIRERHASTEGSFQERWLQAQWDVPRLLAAVEAVLEVAVELDAEDGYRSEGDRIRAAITRELTGDPCGQITTRG